MGLRCSGDRNACPKTDLHKCIPLEKISYQILEKRCPVEGLNGYTSISEQEKERYIEGRFLSEYVSTDSYTHRTCSTCSVPSSWQAQFLFPANRVVTYSEALRWHCSVIKSTFGFVEARVLTCTKVQNLFTTGGQ